MWLALREMLQLHKKSAHTTFGLWSVRLNAAPSFPGDARTPLGPRTKRLPPPVQPSGAPYRLITLFLKIRGDVAVIIVKYLTFHFDS